MALLPDWLSAYFQQTTIRDGVGDDMPTRGFLKFVGPAVSYDGEQVIVTVGAPAVHESTGDYTVAETSGDVYIGLSALAANATVKAPGAPTIGMRITVSIEDTSLATYHVTFDSQGGTVKGPDSNASTYVVTKEDWGTGTVAGPAVTFIFNGTVWKVA